MRPACNALLLGLLCSAMPSLARVSAQEQAPAATVGESLEVADAAATGPSTAPDRLRRIRTAYNEGEFPTALLLAEELEGKQDLTTAELVELLEIRVLIHWPLRDEPASNAIATRALRQIAVIDPDHDSRNFGPDIRAQLREIQLTARLNWNLSCVGRERSVARAELVGDAVGLARSVVLRARGRQSGDVWHEQRALPPEVEVRLPDSHRHISMEASVAGPGRTHLSVPNDVAEVVCPVLDLSEDESAGDDTGLWIAVGTGSALAVAAGVALAFVLTDSSGEVLGNIRLRE